MKTKTKLTRLWSILLALAMVVGLLPATSLTAYAAQVGVVVEFNVYVSNKDTGKKYQFRYDAREKNPYILYYTNGGTGTGTLEENPNWNAYYDYKTRTLYLRDYDDGRILANQRWLDDTDLVIKLSGNNTITNNTTNSAISTDRKELTISTEEYDNATLTITNTNYYEGIYAKKLNIGGYADVTVNVPILTDDNYTHATGIYASEVFALADHASCTVNIINESGAEEYAYGIDAKEGIKLSTSGTLNIDVSQAGKYSFGIYVKSGNNNITHVDSIIIRYNKVEHMGGPFYPEDLFEDIAADYAININDAKGIATYRYGTHVRTVTVTNGMCDASGKSTGQFFAGDTVHVTANEAPEGYRLKGWTSNDVTVPSASVLTTSFTMPDKDVTVSAEYDLRPHTVTFQTWGITEAPKNQIVKYGEKAKKPTDPVSDYYTFAGWYKDDKYTIPFDFKNTPITEDITLYANWLIGTIHTVTFANGNNAPSTTSELPEAQLVADGKLAAKPEPDPTAEGWIFGGWMKDPTGYTGYFDFATETITKDITLYADWAEPYYVYFDANGGTGTMEPVAVIPGYDCTIPECGFTAPEDKQFKGWAFDANSTEIVQFTSFEVSGGDKTLYAIWSDVHTHSWATEYSSDENYHWFDCTVAGCDITENSDKLGYDAHNYDREIATDEYKATDGTYYKSCICGAKGTETFEYLYTITVTGGTASVGAGTPITKATMGTTVTLTANAAPTGKEFDKWVVVSGDVTLADASKATTTFTMPKGDVIVKATYKDESGSGIKYGDLSGDGKINLLDLVAMRKYLAKWSITVDIAPADCNADGKINLMDLILLRKYLAKWSVTLGPQK